MMKLFIAAFFCSISVCSQAQEITPMPAELKAKDGVFKIGANTQIAIDGRGTEKALQFLQAYLGNYYNLKLRQTSRMKMRDGQAYIYLHLNPSISKKPGYYEMEVKDDKIEITGNTDTAVFYGVQTLIQLMEQPGQEALHIPGVKIKDYPRFAYRGMHLDVARHFFPPLYIKKYIDYLALHKMNNFHWHLTDDQGWRLEIKKYPLLTSVGGCRDQTLSGRYGSDKYDGKKYCGFYTQEEVKDIIAYAAARYINIIPEIEMPGHASAAIAAYPQLSCDPTQAKKVVETWGVFPDIICPTEYSFNFMQDVMDEVISLFPSAYIHIGGDEAPKTAWKSSDYAQQLIKKENLKDEHGLQSYFISRMEKYINSKGRNIIGWDEILEGGLAPNATVMSWRGEKGGIEAARQGHYVVMTPESPLYFDHSQTRNEDSLTRGNYNPLEKVYAYNPLPAALAVKDQKYILGAQGNVWAEYLDNGRKVDYMIFPRMSALAEALWTPLDKKDWNSFEKRLPGLMKKYDRWQTSYSTAYFDLQPAVVPSTAGGIAWELKTRYPNAVITYVKGKSPDVVYTYADPVVIDKSGTYSATISDENGKGIEKWARQSFILNKATGKPITLTTQPNASYGGSGGFSLVDGIQNESGMLKSQQFLGFAGKDLEAVIDLGSRQAINAISLHAFEQQGSWIYAPAMVLFYSSNDGKNFILMPGEVTRTGQKNLVYALPINMTTRYIKVQAQNMGTIPEGLPGAGSKAWLFADEITVE